MSLDKLGKAIKVLEQTRPGSILVPKPIQLYGTKTIKESK